MLAGEGSAYPEFLGTENRLLEHEVPLKTSEKEAQHHPTHPSSPALLFLFLQHCEREYPALARRPHIPPLQTTSCPPIPPAAKHSDRKPRPADSTACCFRFLQFHSGAGSQLWHGIKFNPPPSKCTLIACFLLFFVFAFLCPSSLVENFPNSIWGVMTDGRKHPPVTPRRRKILSLYSQTRW